MQLHTASRTPSLRRKPQSRAMHSPPVVARTPLPWQGGGRRLGPNHLPTKNLPCQARAETGPRVTVRYTLAVVYNNLAEEVVSWSFALA